MTKKILLNSALTLAMVAGMSVSAFAADTVQIVLEADNAPYTYEDESGNPA